MPREHLSFTAILLGFFISALATPAFPIQSAYGALKFSVPANEAARSAREKLKYDPETGIFSFLDERAVGARSIRVDAATTFKALSSFGPIKGLRPSELEILAAEMSEATPGQPRALVLRHGQWVTIVDPVADRVIASNLGPFEMGPLGNDFNKVLVQSDGTVVATFGVRAIRTHLGENVPESFLFIYSSDGDKVGFLPMRTDQRPRNPSVALVNDGVLSLKGQYLYFEAPKKDDKKIEVPTPVVADGEVEINLKSGRVIASGGVSLLKKERLVQKVEKSLDGMYEALGSSDHLKINVLPQILLRTSNPNDPKALTHVLTKAKDEIARLRGVSTAIVDAMSNLYGQDEVIKSLAKFAQSQVDADSYAMILFAGPTGVGKTSGFEMFIDGWMRVLNVTSEKPVFYMSLGDISDEKFLESRLKGGTPPYVGSDAPSPIIEWLLKNPNGGGLFFDEIDKSKPEVFEKLIAFLDKGEISMNPHLVSKMCERLKTTPKDQWPHALFIETNGGANPQVEIRLKLTKNHIVGFGTNAGNANFGDSGKGRELKTDQDIVLANQRFTAEVVKNELIKERNYKAEIVNRIQRIFPFKKILKADHARAVEARLREISKKFEKHLIEFRFTEAAKNFLIDETYDTSAGLRLLKNKLETWITDNLNEATFSAGAINPGDQIEVDVESGNGATRASVLKLRRDGSAEVLQQYNVGHPLPIGPREVLLRAQQRLRSTLEKRIVGHRTEIDLLTKAIIKKLSIAAADPRQKGRPIVIYFDGTPGIGKTEIAKAVAEALFDDPSRLTRVDFNEIVDLATLYRFGIDKMNAAIRTNPESQVILWDELHRLTHAPAHQMIENTLMGPLDEGKLPVGPDTHEKIDLPAATIIIATGNLLELALRPGARSMSNRELHAEFRLLMRHPEQYLGVFERSFGGAFRSRLGAPMLFSPLTDEEVAILRDRIFAQNTQIIRDAGVTAVLTDSAKEFFVAEYIPLEGARWIRRMMELYVENAVVTMVVGHEDKYRGSKMEIRFDSAKRQLIVEVSRNGASLESEVLATLPRSRSDYHPNVREQTAWKTSVHEAAGHALVRGALYGEDSIAEINTFGGGQGGWMERNSAAEGEEMYHGTKSGIKEIAVMLAGHLAELKYLGVSANGASSDFDRARSVAQTMLIDGSMPDIAPISLIKNPSTGQVEMSEDKKRELERKTDFILEYAGRIAQSIIDKNERLGLELALALHDDPNMHMEGTTFQALVGGRLLKLVDADFERSRVEAVKAVQQKITETCESLLLGRVAPVASTSDIARLKLAYNAVIGE